jgi:hypothetical protein
MEIVLVDGIALREMRPGAAGGIGVRPEPDSSASWLHQRRTDRVAHRGDEWAGGATGGLHQSPTLWTARRFPADGRGWGRGQH